MTLDEIISNAEFCANEYKKFSEIAPERSLTFKKYEEDHRQLAEWLKDYKRLKEQELSEDWHDIPSGEMTLEQARQAVRELRKYVMDNHILSKSEDMISRQMVKEQMIQYGFHAPDMTVTEFVEDLPPVNPQEPKTGCWEKTTDEYSYWYRCSCCGERIPKNFWGNNYFSPYCPECGAQMVEPQESEDV